MTFAAIKNLLDEAKAIGAELGPETILEMGLESDFVRVACILESYADGYQDAGGSLERLQSHEMDESYAVEINELIRRLKA